MAAAGVLLVLWGILGLSTRDRDGAVRDAPAPRAAPEHHVAIEDLSLVREFSIDAVINGDPVLDGQTRAWHSETKVAIRIKPEVDCFVRILALDGNRSNSIYPRLSSPGKITAGQWSDVVDPQTTPMLLTPSSAPQCLMILASVDETECRQLVELVHAALARNEPLNETGPRLRGARLVAADLVSVIRVPFVVTEAPAAPPPTIPTRETAEANDLPPEILQLPDGLFAASNLAVQHLKSGN